MPNELISSSNILIHMNDSKDIIPEILGVYSNLSVSKISQTDYRTY